MRLANSGLLVLTSVVATVALVSVVAPGSAHWPGRPLSPSAWLESQYGYAKKPRTVVTLKRGETATVQLCWDEAFSGIGLNSGWDRIFLGPSPGPTYVWGKAEAGIPRFERDGLVAEVDAKESVAVQAAMYRWAEKTKKKGDPVRQVKVVVIRLTAARDAAVGVSRFYVWVPHDAVGTYPPEGMVGEVRVLVRE